MGGYSECIDEVLITLFILQEKENRRAEMLALVEIQEADKMSLEVMNEERRKKAKVGVGDM